MYILYYLQTEEYDKAEKYCDTIENVLATGYSYLDAIVYRLKIYVGQGKYEKALELADKALLTITDSSDVSWLSEIYRQKMKILAKTGQAEELFNVATIVIERTDSLYRRDIAYQVDELRTKYDLDRHIREKENMVREKENIRRYLYISTLACIIILLTWMYHSRIINRKNRGLMRKINEQDMMFAERNGRSRHHGEHTVQSFPFVRVRMIDVSIRQYVDVAICTIIPPAEKVKTRFGAVVLGNADGIASGFSFPWR
jgi:tetratricopeptide (TPR) repeat protein